MRLFFAIPLPGDVKEELARFQAQARKQGVAASWPDPEGLHLTLAFLGELEEAKVPPLLDIVQRSVAKHAAFPLRTSRLGGFPKDDSARVLWLGLEEQPRLHVLAGDLRQALRVASAPFDDKPFRAHLTLARFKLPQSVARFGDPSPKAFEVCDVVLFQSAHARYLPLGSVALGPTETQGEGMMASRT